MRTKIVILSAFLSPYRSGAEAMVEEVAQRLGHDYEITIITGRYDRNRPAIGSLGPDVRVIRVGLGLSIDKYLFPLLGALKARSLRPRIIHAVLESYAGLALVLCRFLYPQAKRLLTLQSTNTSFLLGSMHRSAHRITAISSFLIERAKRFGRNDVALIPNGIALTAIRARPRTTERVANSVLFVGRLEHMKGVDTLLRALASVPELKLRIVGDGSERHSLEALAQKLGIADRVTFTGRVSPETITDEYDRAEIFCGLSRSEALGNVFLEAQAAGCAVIATRVGGIPEIVHDGVDGLLVPSNDPLQAAAALRRIVDDTVLRDRLAAAGKQGKERYDWDTIAQEYARVYRELL